MSIPRKISVCCPKCHTAFPATIWDSVNTNLSKDLSQKVISGEFFDAKCPKCGLVTHLEYDMLYHDMEHSTFIWVVHTDNKKYSEKLREIRDSQNTLDKSLPGYKMRVVDDINQLREKVAALDAGRDDRIIELCKLFLAEDVKRQNPHFVVAHLFYTYQGKKEIMYCYDTSENELHGLLDDDYYNEVEQIFAKALKQMPGFFPPVYDAEWATQFFDAAEIKDVSAPEAASGCSTIVERLFLELMSDMGLSPDKSGKYQFPVETSSGIRTERVSFDDIRDDIQKEYSEETYRDNQKVFGEILKKRMKYLLSACFADPKDFMFVEYNRKIREAEDLIILGEKSAIVIQEAEKSGMTPEQFLKFQELIKENSQHYLDKLLAKNGNLTDSKKQNDVVASQQNDDAQKITTFTDFLNKYKKPKTSEEQLHFAIQSRKKLSAAYKILKKSISDYPFKKNSEKRRNNTNPSVGPDGTRYQLDIVWDKFVCDKCGTESVISTNRTGIVERYQEIASEYIDSGYYAKVTCTCGKCLKGTPIGAEINFSFSFPDDKMEVMSHPNHFIFNDMQYKVALAFLKGAYTLQELSNKTETQFSPEEYVDCIKTVVG